MRQNLLRIPDRLNERPEVRKPLRVPLIAIVILFASVFASTFNWGMTGQRLILHLGLELVYLALFALVVWKSRLPQWLTHGYLVVQSALVFSLLYLQPDFNLVTLLFFCLTYQVTLSFKGGTFWVWIGILVILTGVPIIYYRGFFAGLGETLTTMAGEIVFPAYLVATQAAEDAKTRSQDLLSELTEKNRQLRLYSGQVEESAALEERSRLASMLHDSVSQTMFSISLTARAAETLLEKDPPRARAEIARLQTMTSGALGQLRSLISEMRPPSKPQS